ncbi:uncharacterized protein LOC144924577 [Branchiostoma floridae x Branchiostoma belcheri]
MSRYVAGILLLAVLQHTVTGSSPELDGKQDVKQTARKPRVRNLSSPQGGAAVSQGGGKPKPVVGRPSVVLPNPVVSRPGPGPYNPRKPRVRDLVPKYQYPVGAVPPNAAVQPLGGARPYTVVLPPAPAPAPNPYLNPVRPPARLPVPYPTYPRKYPPGHPMRAKRDAKSSESTKAESDKSSENIKEILENILSAPLATNDADTKNKTLLKPQNPDEFAVPDDLSSTPVPPVRLPIAVATFPPGMPRPKPKPGATTVGPPLGRAMGVRRTHNSLVGIRGPPRTPVAPGVRQVWTPENLPTLQPRWCGGNTFGEANGKCLNWEFCMMAPGVQEGYCKQKCCFANHECGYPGAVCVGAQPAEDEDNSILGLCYGPPAHPGNDVSRAQHDVRNKQP